MHTNPDQHPTLAITMDPNFPFHYSSTRLTIDLIQKMAVVSNAPAKAKKKGNRAGKKAQVRTRVTVETIYRGMGDLYFRRAYRMSYASFKELSHLLEPLIMQGQKGGNRYVPNGPISSGVRLAAALRC